MRTRLPVAVALAVSLVVTSGPPRTAVGAQAAPLQAADLLAYPFPNELTTAATAPRLVWALNEQGRRNLWAAEAPDFLPRPLTRYDTDDGQELTSVALTPDGSRVVYVRGGDHGSNWDDREPINVLGMPVPPPLQIWTVAFAGGEPRLVGAGDAPVVSPRGDVVAFERDGHIWVARLDGSREPERAVAVAGDNGGIQWAPDGSRFAFVSSREDHAFVGIYTDQRTPVRWLAPSTSRDGSPRWSPDGTRLVFVRRPGPGGAPPPLLEPRHQPWGLWVADAATGEARRIWQAPATPRGSPPTTDGGVNLHWAARDRIVFVSYADGWPHLYSLPPAGGEPLLLTPGGYMVEHVRLTPDGTHVVFAANAGDTAGDIDRRHVVRVPVDRAEPEVLTPGDGLEWSPVVTGDAAHLAMITATDRRPPLVTVRPADGGAARLLGDDRIPRGFPTARLVTPRPVTFRAADGVTVHGQLFEPADLRAGERRPAVVYVHGGPQRQMLLGWHYSDYYARAYASNQLLAAHGFVVLSVNYRLGIGYGYDFHRPRGGGAQGAAEYQDITAAGEYLRALPQVDRARIGIYGGSYGGFLTALALARNSDLFATGVDIHGVHDFTSGGSGSGAAVQAALAQASRPEQPADRDRAARLAWESSPVSSIATWKSPVLLIHGDDDRNVRFIQTVDLVQRLTAAGVTFEELVVPDDTHHWMRHANAVRVHQATLDWFRRFLASAHEPPMP